MRCLLSALIIMAFLASIGCNSAPTVEAEPMKPNDTEQPAITEFPSEQPQDELRFVKVEREFLGGRARAIGEARLSDNKLDVGSLLCSTDPRGDSVLVVSNELVIRLPDMASAELNLLGGQIQYCNWSESGEMAIMGTADRAFSLDIATMKIVRRLDNVTGGWFQGEVLHTVQIRQVDNKGLLRNIYELYADGKKLLTTPEGWDVQAITSDGAKWLASKEEMERKETTFAIWDFRGSRLETIVTFRAFAPNYAGYGMSLFEIRPNSFLAGLGGAPVRKMGVPVMVGRTGKRHLWEDGKPDGNGTTKTDYLLAPIGRLGDDWYVPVVTIASGEHEPKESYSLRRLVQRGKLFTTEPYKTKESIVGLSFSTSTKTGCAIVWRDNGYYAALLTVYRRVGALSRKKGGNNANESSRESITLGPWS